MLDVLPAESFQNVLLFQPFVAPVPTFLRPVAGIKFEMSILNLCYVICVLLWIKYWLMWFESLLVFILFKFKKRPNISEIQVVYTYIIIM